jgi:hypothetical protein
MKTRSFIAFLLTFGFVLGLSLTAYTGYPILEAGSPRFEDRAEDNAVRLDEPVGANPERAAGSVLSVIDAGLYGAPVRHGAAPQGTARALTAEATGILISSL